MAAPAVALPPPPPATLPTLVCEPPPPAPPEAVPAPPQAPEGAREAVSKLLSGVQALMVEAQGGSAVVGLEAAEPSRPRSAPYTGVAADDVSVVSWSADAYGKSKTPGFYHQHRKQIAANRRAMAAKEPKGTYTSMSRYADEAHRISNTGRLAF